MLDNPTRECWSDRLRPRPPVALEGRGLGRSGGGRLAKLAPEGKGGAGRAGPAPPTGCNPVPAEWPQEPGPSLFRPSCASGARPRLYSCRMRFRSSTSSLFLQHALQELDLVEERVVLVDLLLDLADGVQHRGVV